MHRNHHQIGTVEHAEGSDPSFSSDELDEVFDVDKADDVYNTDTSIGELDETDGLIELDVEDQLNLFEGNTHSPEYYRRAVETFNASDYESEDYALGTTRYLDGIEEQWIWFCEDFLRRSPQECYETISIKLLQAYFDWSLNQRLSRDGTRKRKKVTKSSSLGTHWKVFRLVFERATNEKIDPKLNRTMHKVLRTLAKKHGLSDQRRMNRCMTTDDLKLQIETTLGTTKKSFKLGELRILAVLFLLLLAPAGARPTSILRLRFGDLHPVLARDPEGGPPKILIWFSLSFTKTYLGEKEVKSYPIPETMYDPSLMLSPHVFLLGILFRHRAFRAPSLTSPHQLDGLNIHPDEHELPLPLREDLHNVFIFRRALETFGGYQLSPNEPITSAMMAAWIKRIGEILGIEYPTISYSLRYNAGNVWDQSPDVSEALRNLAMDHTNSTPFRKNYLGRNIGVDLWGIIRGQKPQQAIIKQSCSIGHSVSKRRPVDLTPDQAASILTHPLITRLSQKLKTLPQQSKEYKEAKRVLHNEKQRLRRELKQTIRAKWTAKQAVEDIELQLHGLGFAKPPKENSFYRPQRLAQKQLIQALTAPIIPTLEGQYRRRDNAIEAISAYCLVQEGCTIRVRRSPASSTKPSEPTLLIPSCKSLKQNLLSLTTLSIFIKRVEERLKRYFIYVG
ncbi:C2H2 finger domain protein [Hypoxylon sp. FL0890]|nr:C2H2 finger domain protein [Hypoxylon sp. FL0890]